MVEVLESTCTQKDPVCELCFCLNRSHVRSFGTPQGVLIPYSVRVALIAMKAGGQNTSWTKADSIEPLTTGHNKRCRLATGLGAPLCQRGENRTCGY